MDFGFRELLVITGVLLLGYLIWDGWRSRSRDQYKFKLEKTIPPDGEGARAREGFDRDGVGRMRVKSPTGWDDDGSDAGGDDDHDEPGYEHRAGSNERHATSPEMAVEKSSKVYASDDKPVEQVHVEPVFGDEPVTADSPANPSMAIGDTGELFADADTAARARNKTRARETVKSAPAKKTAEDSDERSAPPAFQVISLTVHAPEGKVFDGGALSIALMEASLTFGEMDIFHRHLDGTPNSEIQFSVANAVKPGTFDPDNLASFSTPGISLFMQMPGPKDPRLAYDLMVKAAEQIARTLGGTILDGLRQPFGTESRRAHDAQIRQFERSTAAKV